MKKKVILTVSGVGQSGKSSTIKRLIDLLGLHGLVTNLNLKDWDLITIYKGIKLGRCSGGDPGAKKPTDWLDKATTIENCDIVVIASRSGGETLTRLYGYKDYVVMEINKFCLSSQSPCLQPLSQQMLDYGDYLNAAEIAKIIEVIIMFGQLCAAGCCDGKDTNSEIK